MVTFKTLAVALGLILLVPFTAISGLIHIPGDSSNIQLGINGALSGDTVLVAAGTYAGDGNRDLEFLGKNVILLGDQGPELTIIDCGGTEVEHHRGFYLHEGEDESAVIEGFTITNAYDDFAAVYVTGATATIRDCIITNNNCSGISGASYPNYVRIRDCIISHNLEGVTIYGSAYISNSQILHNNSNGVGAYSPSILDMDSCLMYDNAGYGLYFRHGFFGIQTINNCTFVGNVSGMKLVDDPPKTDKVSRMGMITNCLFAFNQNYGIDYDWSYPDLQCCDAYGNAGGDFHGTTELDPAWNNFSMNPYFCDTAAMDFHIDELSPCAAGHPYNPCGVLIGAYGTGCQYVTDTDMDGVPDEIDNCVSVFNPAQEDLDGDGIGDSCDVLPRVWYVKADGSGDAPTIQAAIDSSIAFDTVLVAAGTYTGDGNRDLDFNGKNIILLSEDGADMTVIDCEGSDPDQHRGFYLHSGEDTTAVIDGFTITGAYWDEGNYIGRAAIYLDNSAAAIRNCIITANAHCGLVCDGSYGVPLIFAITDCAFVGNGLFGVAVNESSIRVTGSIFDSNNIGIMASGWDDCIFDMYDCAVMNNTFEGVVVFWPIEFHVSNCTFFNNKSGFYFEWTPPKGEEKAMPAVSTLSYCLSAYNTINGIENAFGYSDYEILCCNSFGNGNADWVGTDYSTGDENGNLSLDPMFCDTTELSLNIDALSPCAAAHPLNQCGVLIGKYDVGCSQHSDTDGDGVADEFDNCVSVYNPLQEDTDEDGIGDACELSMKWYVKADGTGDAPTIQAAIDLSADYDTVLVAAGTYTGPGNRELDFLGKSILVVSESGPQMTVIDCEGSDMVPRFGVAFYKGETEQTLFEGFTITGAYSSMYADSGAILCNNSTPIIRDCIVIENEGNGIRCLNGGSPSIYDCDIIQNRGFGLQVGGGPNYESRPLLFNCNISYNDSDGVFVRWVADIAICSTLIRGNGDCGVHYRLFAPGTLEMYNNTIVENRCGMLYDYEPPKDGMIDDMMPASFIRGNVFAFNTDTGFRVLFTVDAECTCNNSYGNPGGDWVPGIAAPYAGDAYGNISADPLFCNRSGGDFRLDPASPCAPDNNSCNTLMGAFFTGCSTICGDIDGDGSITILDITFLISYLYKGGPAPDTLDNADVNNSGTIDILDVIYLIRYLYKGGPPPACP
ncbi:MAG: right-handed parallel beta-helix repeat-containing protein [Candidatus Zixiibacteriota bacterium]